MALTLVRLGRVFFGRGDSGYFHWEDWVFVLVS